MRKAEDMADISVLFSATVANSSTLHPCPKGRNVSLSCYVCFIFQKAMYLGRNASPAQTYTNTIDNKETHETLKLKHTSFRDPVLLK